MTEFWKSTAKYFCEVCKVWMQDNPHSRMTHEMGIKHKDNVARKLADMRKKADTEKRTEAHLSMTMASIEVQAKAQFEADQRAAKELKHLSLGQWVLKEDAGYFYNSVHRYYYDIASGMYYGGDPVEWTSNPAIPHEARYEVMNKPLPPPSQPPPAAARAAAAVVMPAAAAAKPSAKAAVVGARAGERTAPAHPLAGVGGYQMPTVGRIGGAKGVGSSSVAAAAVGDAAKRKREGDAGGKALSKEEEEALARREAARQRVQQRTMSTFGLGF